MSTFWQLLASPASLWRVIHGYVGGARRGRGEPVADRAALQRFLDSRASFVAQMSLYGYLRTRAGMRYPELFSNDEFVKAVDAAKWQMWLACLSDLSVYAGGLLARRGRADTARIAALMQATLEAVLSASGVTHDPARVERVRTRLALCDWTAVPDDGTPFSESPRVLIECAPIVDELKQLDEEIVRNSVRFRWQQVRRELRRALDADALMASEAARS